MQAGEDDCGAWGRGEDPVPRRRIIVGRALVALCARAPWAWPLVRGRVRTFFDSTASTWEARTGSADPEHLAPLSAGVCRARGQPERILELGCGTGRGTVMLATEFPGARVRGVDLSEAMVAEARRRVGLDPEGRVHFRVADAADLPWEDESFDLVCQLNLPPFFEETARVLRPGGHAVVATSGGPAVPFWTPDSVLARGFRRAGLEVVESGRAARGTWFLARRPHPGGRAA